MSMVSIPDELRNECLQEDKGICMAVGRARGGDHSSGEMIQSIVARKHAQCKHDPNQFNAVYAYAKTRHMLERYKYLLSLSEEDGNSEVTRFVRLRTIDLKTLLLQYFSLPEMADRFTWSGRLCSAEARMIYDIMQLLAIHPMATVDEYIQTMSTSVAAKTLAHFEGVA